MNPIINIILRTLAVGLAAYVTPGVHIRTILTAIAVAVIFAILNHVVKPVLVLLTLPITIVTLGLFLLVLNAALVAVTAWIVPGFTVDGFWSAVLFSVLLTLFNWVFAVEGNR